MTTLNNFLASLFIKLFHVSEEIPYINVPLHTLLVVKSYGYDFEIDTIPLKGKYLGKLILFYAISLVLVWLDSISRF